MNRIQTTNDEVQSLRADATATAAELAEGVEHIRRNVPSNEDLYNVETRIHDEFNQEFQILKNNIQNKMNQLSADINNLSAKLNFQELDSEDEDYPMLGRRTPRPPPSDKSTRTRFDLDHDVIMRSRWNNLVQQVPDPGYFSGKTNETDLFCQLCEATFKTYPNNLCAEDFKVNFVQTRLRDSARNWYLTKYPDNVMPATMNELLEGLKTAFSNISSYKLAKIQLVELKQEYNNINKYIEEFRRLATFINIDEPSLAMFFYSGLHPKFKEDIQKLETFPDKLETIVTRTILFNNSLNLKKKINETKSSNKGKKSSNNNSKNNNNNSNNSKNYNNNNSKNYNNNFKNKSFSKDSSNQVTKAEKISSKN